MPKSRYNYLFIILVFVPDPLALSAKLKSCSSSISFLNKNFNQEKSPFVLKSTQTPEFFYPTIEDVRCYSPFEKNTMLPKKYFRLSCAHSHLRIINETLHTSYMSVRYYPTQDLLALSNDENIIKIDFYDDTEIECTNILSSILKPKDQFSSQIGFQLNAADFLSVIEILHNKDYSFVWARSTVLSIIEERAKLIEDPPYRSGRNYFNLNFTKIYTKEYQTRQFEFLLQNKTLVEKYFPPKDDNYLIKSQLISKKDLFYVSQQKCSFFHENTIPVWRSIAEGNWKFVSDIIRKMAADFITNFEVYAGAIQILDDKVAIYLGNKYPSSKVQVYGVLFKIVYDPMDNARSIVFLTVNNPRLDFKTLNRGRNDYVICDKLSVCDKLYPEFLQVEKGYTYCCSLENFPHWNKIKKGDGDFS